MHTCRCGLPAVVQWQRRPTAAETAAIQAAAEARLAAAVAAGLPAPKESLPTAAESVVAVYACADHSLSPDDAALIHQSTCTGPGRDGRCNCVPEAPVPDSPTPDEPGPRLPPGW